MFFNKMKRPDFCKILKRLAYHIYLSYNFVHVDLMASFYHKCNQAVVNK